MVILIALLHSPPFHTLVNKDFIYYLFSYVHVYILHNMKREITASTQGNGSDQLPYEELYVSANIL